MTIEAEVGRIHAADIEELNYAVWPWDLRMRQISTGRFLADLEFAQINGILLTHERWSRRVSATGATPPGYLALGGTLHDTRAAGSNRLPAVRGCVDMIVAHHGTFAC